MASWFQSFTEPLVVMAAMNLLRVRGLEEKGRAGKIGKLRCLLTACEAAGDFAAVDDHGMSRYIRSFFGGQEGKERRDFAG